MNKKSNKSSIFIETKNMNIEERRKIIKLLETPSIWDFDDIGKKVIKFSNEKKLKNKGDDEQDENAIIYGNAPLHEYTTLEELDYFLKIAGFKEIFRAESIREHDVGGMASRVETNVLAAHPSGILIKSNTYGENKHGQKKLSSIHIRSEIDLGIGELGYYTSRFIRIPGSSSGDFQKHGGNSKNLMSVINTNSGYMIGDLISHLNSLQEVGKIKTFDKWSKDWIIFNASPLDVMSVNENTYPDIFTNDNIVEKILDDYIDKMDGFLKNDKENELVKKCSNIKGLEDLIKYIFFSYGDIYGDKKIKLYTTFRDKVLKKYPNEMSLLESKRQSKHLNKKNKDMPSFLGDGFNWRDFERGLIELDKYGFENHIRYLSDTEKETLVRWIDFIEKFSHDDDNNHIKSLKTEDFQENKCFETIAGGFSFPAFLFAEAYKNVNLFKLEYFELLNKFIEKGDDNFIKNICSNYDLSGKTFPMRMIEHITSGKNYFFYSEDEEEIKKQIELNTNKIITSLINKVGSENIALSSSKYSPNGIWLMNFIKSSTENNTYIKYLGLKNYLDVFKQNNVKVDDDWNLFLPIKFNYESDRSLEGSKQLFGEKLEDIVNDIDVLKENPLVLSKLLEEGIVGLREDKNKKANPIRQKRKM